MTFETYLNKLNVCQPSLIKLKLSDLVQQDNHNGYFTGRFKFENLN